MHSIRSDKCDVLAIALVIFPAICLFSITVSSPRALAQPPAPQATSVRNFSNANRAQLISALSWRRKMDQKLAPIHSHKELVQYLKITANMGSPLDALSPTARKRFLSSLKFKHGGLAGYKYQDLQHLTPAQTYAILALFGAQSDTRMIVSNKLNRLNPSFYCIKGITPNCPGGKDHKHSACTDMGKGQEPRCMPGTGICNPKYCHYRAGCYLV